MVCLGGGSTDEGTDREISERWILEGVEKKNSS